MTTGLLVDAGSGMLLVWLALFVATRRPVRTLTLSFGLFAGLWGAEKAVGNVFRYVSGEGPSDLYIFTNLADMGAAVALVFFAIALVEEAWHGRPAILALAAAAAATSLVLPLLHHLDAATPGLRSHALGGDVLLAAVIGVQVFLVLCWHRGEAAGVPIAAAALMLDSGIRVGVGLIERLDGGWFPFLWVGWLLVLATLWLAGGERRRQARTARRMALWILALPLAGASAAVFLTTGDPFDSGIFGLARFLAVAILAYAILRHQLLDIDVRVRWTVSKSTLAAVFVTVMFIVSEGAQEVFGEFSGSEFVGIAAAAGLVFFIAPLQRFADRLAVHAVPSTQVQIRDPISIYAAALRAAMADGSLTRDEERVLAEVQEGLRISAPEALKVREVVEQG